MGSLTDDVRNLGDDGKGYVQLTVGRVVALPDAARVTVNIAGLQITMGNVGLDRPIVGDSVRVAYTDGGFYLCLGPVAPRAPLGTIQSVNTTAGTVVVLGSDGVTYSDRRYLTSYTPAVGDLVAISWAQNGLVLGKQSAAQAATGGGGNPTPPPVVTAGTSEFQAIDSGTYKTSWFTNDVYYGSTSNKGLWFYGTAPFDSLNGATITGARIYLPVKQSSGNRYLYLNYHGYATRPGGNPGLAGSQQIDGGGATGWYALDLGFAQYLVNNRGGGIGTSGPGLRVFAGTGSNGDSGKLSLDWRR